MNIGNTTFTCLIVDDSPGIRQVLKNYLEQGVEKLNRSIVLSLHQANNGQEALELLQEMNLDGHAPNLIILDWMMPHFSGLEFLTELRATKALHRAQSNIAVLSAESYPQQINLMLSLGVMQYLIKPFAQEDIDELLEAVFKMQDYSIAPLNHLNNRNSKDSA